MYTSEVIDNKLKMYKFLWRGVLGNHFKWQTYKDWERIVLQEGYPFSSRYSVRFGTHLGAPWLYNLTYWDVVFTVQDCKSMIDSISVVTMPAKLVPLFQGELTRDESGLYLFYSNLPYVMREALVRDGKEAKGLKVKYLLEHYLDPSSYEDIQELLELYPNHIIEFTVYNKDVGIMPHRNTVIWEVRHY